MTMQDPPIPTIAAARKAITDRVIRECIALYHRAERAQAEADGAIGDDPELANIGQVLVDRLHAAEQNLVRAILAPAGRPPGGSAPEKYLWPSHGVRCDGRLYLVTRHDHGEALRVGEELPHGTDIMHLTVVDLANVADAGTLADDPVYHPDGSRIHHINDDDDDDGPAEATPVPTPRRREPATRVEPPPLPLAKSLMTFNSPAEPGYLVSLEVQVFDQCVEGQASGPAEAGIMGEAGWMVHSLGPMTIAFRTVC